MCSSHVQALTKYIWFLQAVTFVGFLTGFVVVLCIGNYFRAQRAMERQKQRRLARLSGVGGNGVIGVDSPGSHASSQLSDEHHSLLGRPARANMNGAQRRRGNFDDGTDSLLLDLHDDYQRPGALISAVWLSGKAYHLSWTLVDFIEQCTTRTRLARYC